jgi:ferredoxin
VRALIVGSGPAAAGAALALTDQRGVEVTVLDLGLELEEDLRRSVQHLAVADPATWDPGTVARVSAQPVESLVEGLPEKRAYGSDFPFRDIGQLRGVEAGTDAHARVISAAYGGFSNVWGSQVMPFTEATLATWPIGAAGLAPHYRAVLGEVPYAGGDDDLAELFPHPVDPAPLPDVSARTHRVLTNYERHRSRLHQMGIRLGRARLALRAPACVRCGLCMTGCPYGLIYSASQTFDRLRAARRITYYGGLLALRVVEEADAVAVAAKELSTGRVRTFRADRAYLGAGAMGTTRLVINSLGLFGQTIAMGESVQFTLPILSARPVADPRQEHQFTLNQFNMLIGLDGAGLDVSQLHFYTYNPAFIDALPAILRRAGAEGALAQVLRRTSVALGYLPSWASPRLWVEGAAPAEAGELGALRIEREESAWGRNRMLRRVLARVLRAAPLLDLYPVVPKMTMAAGAKSYHWGGSFPHRDGPPTLAASDLLGRVGPWSRVHLVDASVFPNVPATTFTLTIMANAHRIAGASLGVGS